MLIDQNKLKICLVKIWQQEIIPLYIVKVLRLQEGLVYCFKNHLKYEIIGQYQAKMRSLEQIEAGFEVMQTLKIRRQKHQEPHQNKYGVK
jgi:hypothetical protein